MTLRASLYVHAPFCRGKCRYCAFYSAPTGPAGPTAPQLSRYLCALEAEMDRQAAAYGSVAAPTLFFGGGTPSLLGAEALERILAGLRQRFDLAPDAEITLESNPDSATPELLRAARRLGVNRLSLGVQSLDDADLQALGRVHDARQAREAFAAARACGFDNIGLDLIFGLPGQSVPGWLDVLRQAVDLGPEHLSCYGLTVEPGTPLAADENALAALPDDDRQAEMFLRGSELLQAAGYAHYEISNFARTGGLDRRCRHNLACWRGEDVLGFGPAAVSTMPAPVGMSVGATPVVGVPVCEAPAAGNRVGEAPAAGTQSSEGAAAAAGVPADEVSATAMPVGGAPAAGMRAVGATPGPALRWANPAHLEAWAAQALGEAPQPGRTAQPPREVLTPDIRAREALMLALRTAEGLDLDAFARSKGQDLRQLHAELLEQLAAAGLVERQAGRLNLTLAGMLVSNSVIRALGF